MTYCALICWPQPMGGLAWVVNTWESYLPVTDLSPRNRTTPDEKTTRFTD